MASATEKFFKFDFNLLVKFKQLHGGSGYYTIDRVQYYGKLALEKKQGETNYEKKSLRSLTLQCDHTPNA